MNASQAGYDDFNTYAWDVSKDGMTNAQHWTLSGHENRVSPSCTAVEKIHFMQVSCLGISPSGECLCTGSWDALLKVWA